MAKEKVYMVTVKLKVRAPTEFPEATLVHNIEFLIENDVEDEYICPDGSASIENIEVSAKEL